MLGDEAIAAGAEGILLGHCGPKVATNLTLVLYPRSCAERDTRDIIDPQRVLPKNQESWRRKTGSARPLEGRHRGERARDVTIPFSSIPGELLSNLSM